MSHEEARDLLLRRHFASLAANSSSKLFFDLMEPQEMEDFLGSDARAGNPIYKFTLKENGKELIFVGYSLILNGQTRSSTRAEALGRALTSANGRLFEINPFLLTFDYVGNQLLAVSAAKLFGAFAKKATTETIMPSKTAAFTLSPHFKNETISMYAVLGKPDVWAAPFSRGRPTLDELRTNLLRFKNDTDQISSQIPSIVEILKARIATRDSPKSVLPAEPLQPSLLLPPRVEKLEVEEQTDVKGHGTGVETDDTAPDVDPERIAEPFDPEDIDVITRSMTVDLLLSRTESEMIDLQPDFQRRWGIWDNRRQSRLIESLLLRIPLPVLYAAEDEDERWEIVDGIQRLSTIARFIRPAIVEADPLILTGLEYLTQYNGKEFSDLSSRLQMRLRETELVIHLIRKGTPPEVKFNIFARINTGGVALSPQELRHAITPGEARKVLEDWASSNPFKLATDGSVRSTRMDDRELVLRFIAFYTRGLDGYRQPDMDGFLVNAMRAINGFTDEQLGQIWFSFVQALEGAHAIFGNDAFRKRFSPDSARSPINKALFEAVTVSLAKLNDYQISRLIGRKDEVREGIIELCNDRAFESAISQGTGDVKKVSRRFSEVERMFARVLEHD